MGYEHIEITQEGHVATLWLNRPDKLNAMSADMWADLPAAMADLDADDSVRVVVLAGRGRSFTVGIDLNMLATLQPTGTSAAESNMNLYQRLLEMQKATSCFADSPKPVIAAIHGNCLGAGMDLITACDIRLATADATFSVRETKMGLAADMGTLQRLPGIVGAGTTAEMTYSGSDFNAAWAKEKLLVNEIYPDAEALHVAAQELASTIAANSPLAVQGTKAILRAAESQTTEQSLDYVAQWNSSFLISNDLMEAVNAFMEKRDPDFTGT